jgi:antitoxin MazE
MRTRSSRRKRPREKPSNGLTAKLVKIGNSRGVRLPKAVIEQAGLEDKVEISVRGNQIILSPVDAEDPRAGWEEAIKRSIEKYGPPEPIDQALEYMPNEFDKEDWTW